MSKSSGVVVVPQTKKTTKKSDYSVKVDMNDVENGSDLDYATVSVSVSKGNARFDFSMQSGDVACCGLKELQQFRVNHNSPSIPESTKVEAVKQLIEEVYNVATERNGECRTLFLTTIDNVACNLVDKALSDGKLFTKVKTFVNSNTHRQNRMYISNN